MATKQDLFISVSPEIYRKDKSLILTSQADLLHSLKHIQNLKVLSAQRNDLRKQFHTLVSSMTTQINSLQTKIPAPEIPKMTYKHKKQVVVEPKPKEKTTFSKRDEIEEELRMIQAKLRELNS